MSYQTKSWDDWAKEVLTDFKRPFDDHTISLRIGLVELIHKFRAERDVAESALQRKGYRKSCDIPACNCGDQWTHGGHAEMRLREIGEELADESQVRTLLEAVKTLKARCKSACEGEYGYGEGLKHALTELQKINLKIDVDTTKDLG